MADTIADTRRLFTKPQNLNDAYGPPSNFLEIDVSNPETIGVGRGRYTTYEVRLKVSPELSNANDVSFQARDLAEANVFFVVRGRYDLLTSGLPQSK